MSNYQDVIVSCTCGKELANVHRDVESTQKMNGQKKCTGCGKNITYTIQGSYVDVQEK